MGWQMAAIKYERDRAANTLLPNYNTYGKYDIPSYYESYWQSPEERYYTGLNSQLFNDFHRLSLTNVSRLARVSVEA